MTTVPVPSTGHTPVSRSTLEWVAAATTAWVAVWLIEYFNMLLLTELWLLEPLVELFFFAIALSSTIMAALPWRRRICWVSGGVAAAAIALVLGSPTTFATTWWWTHRAEFAEIARLADTGALPGLRDGDHPVDLPLPPELAGASPLTRYVELDPGSVAFIPVYQGIPDDEWGFEHGGPPDPEHIDLGDGWHWVEDR